MAEEPSDSSCLIPLPLSTAGTSMEGGRPPVACQAGCQLVLLRGPDPPHQNSGQFHRSECCNCFFFFFFVEEYCCLLHKLAVLFTVDGSVGITIRKRGKISLECVMMMKAPLTYEEK